MFLPWNPSIVHSFVRKGFLSTDFILCSYLWIPGLLGGSDMNLPNSPSLLLWHPTLCQGRRQWQPTPVFLPGKPHGRRSLVGCRLWGHTESDTAEATQQQQQPSAWGFPGGSDGPTFPQQSHLTADCLANLHSYVKISSHSSFVHSLLPSVWIFFSFVSSRLCFFLPFLPLFFLSTAHFYFKHHYTFFHLHIFPHPDEIFKGRNHTLFTMYLQVQLMLCVQKVMLN